MIGRGLLQNPFLAKEINGSIITNKKDILENFYTELYLEYEKKLEKSHILIRMQKYWEYFSYVFKDQKQVYKKIKKINSLKKYNKRVKEIFTNEIIN